MILRKVSNLRPGDIVKLFDVPVWVESIHPMLSKPGFRTILSKDDMTHIVHKDDLVEIVIL